MSVTKYFLGIKNIKNKNPLEIKLNDLNIILPDKNTFIADPFLFKYEDEYYAFFEEWNYNYGYISCSKLDKNLNFTNIEKILDTKSHLSFPSIFKYKDNIYMVPESCSGGNGMDVYKCIHFPLKWEKEKTIHNINAIDPVFFCNNDVIYIFCGSHKEFKIYYSIDFNIFNEHSINNCTSIKYPRSAGNIFKYQDNFYRPAQICNPCYGYGIAIYRIDLINTKNYKETLIKEIKPTWFPELTGTHTFNICNDLLIIDGRLRVNTPFKQFTGKVWKSTDNDDYVNKHINNLNIEYRYHSSKTK